MTAANDLRRLLAEAATQTNQPDVAHRLRSISERLDAPLRVAIAGRLKAGKSTLLNALVGVQVAETGAGETTRIVTWYQHAPEPSVRRGRSVQESIAVPFTHTSDGLVLGASAAESAMSGPGQQEQLFVGWPAPALETLTLIDTVGLDSASDRLSAATLDALTPEGAAGAADAVVYLMRHLHEADVSLLDAFHGQFSARPSPITAIGVLSRADEIVVGRADAMDVAALVAKNHRESPRLKRYCATVVPVAALVAETAATLTVDEFGHLQDLAACSDDEMQEYLLSVDRFAETDALAMSTETRRQLLDRFGVFGLRIARRAIRDGAASAESLSHELLRQSGLHNLRDVLHGQFAERAEILKSRSALYDLGLLAEADDDFGQQVSHELERITLGFHELAELELLDAIRSGRCALAPDDGDRAQRLLGAFGPGVSDRLGARPDVAEAQLETLALDWHRYWRTMAESPAESRAVSSAAKIVVRSCEGLVASLSAQAG